MLGHLVSTGYDAAAPQAPRAPERMAKQKTTWFGKLIAQLFPRR